MFVDQIGSYPELITVQVLQQMGVLESARVHQEAELLVQRAIKRVGEAAPQRKSQNRNQAESPSYPFPSPPKPDGIHPLQ